MSRHNNKAMRFSREKMRRRSVGINLNFTCDRLNATPRGASGAKEELTCSDFLCVFLSLRHLSPKWGDCIKKTLNPPAWR